TGQAQPCRTGDRSFLVFAHEGPECAVDSLVDGRVHPAQELDEQREGARQHQKRFEHPARCAEGVYDRNQACREVQRLSSEFVPQPEWRQTQRVTRRRHAASNAIALLFVRRQCPNSCCSMKTSCCWMLRYSQICERSLFVGSAAAPCS